MRQVVIKIIILLLAMFILASCNSPRLNRSSKKRAAHSLFQPKGQTAPRDMVFIKGNGKNIPDFYISSIEEPNINYIIYLNWLRAIQNESYPEILEAAMPTPPTTSSGNVYNDPYLKAYMTHPAFAYYPVVNLSWKQIDRYLGWKTDRLNESILIKKEILAFSVAQRAEDNFNTEAFLDGQYEGLAGERYDLLGENETLSIKDGVLFSGFRLPTEEEWDYVSAEKYQKSKKIKNHHFHPFGKDYYTISYSYCPYEEETNDAYRQISFYNASHSKRLPVPKDSMGYHHIEAIQEYAPNTLGILNLAGGVQEWVLDEYKETPNTNKHWLQVMKEGGYNVETAAWRDANRKYLQKRYDGRMGNFRYIADENGNWLEIGLFTAVEEDITAVKEDIIILQNTLKVLKGTQETWVAGQIIEKERILDSLKNLRPNSPIIRQRVVKGGTWKSPSLGRTPMLENQSSLNVGFRTILPYSGQKIDKKYKVQWGSNSFIEKPKSSKDCESSFLIKE